jgi:hypothetical protein
METDRSQTENHHFIEDETVGEKSSTLIIMPFEDAEEEYLWDEIAKQKNG